MGGECRRQDLQPLAALPCPVRQLHLPDQVTRIQVPVDINGRSNLAGDSVNDEPKIKPIVRLIGDDGNACCILAKIKQALMQASGTLHEGSSTTGF